MLRVKNMNETKLTITPFQLADGAYFRLGKKFTKKEMGIILLSCKTMLERFRAKQWQDYEVWAFVDTLIYQMKKNQFPLVFRMFYTIAMSYLNNNVYDVHETEASSTYSKWIEQEINRLKNS